MASARPVCDRHPNLQMVPCPLQRTKTPFRGYVCPVPGCGRHHDDNGYFDAMEAKPALPGDSPKTRRDSARAAILEAIEQQRRPPGLPDKK